MASSQQERGEAFRALHTGPGAFVIPNPWDGGSARLLAGLGFKALATTSSGFAMTLGRVDYQVTRDEKLAHLKTLTDAVDVPISADLENLWAASAADAAETMRLAAATGIVGGSIEDYTGNPDDPILAMDEAVRRVAAAVEVARGLPFPFTVTARAENLLHGRDDLDDTIARLKAFEEVGADVLYAPGLRTLDQIKTVCDAVSKPVNVLGVFVKGASVDQMAEAGAKRISLGGAMARAAAGEVIRASRELLDAGTQTFVARVAGAELGEAMKAGAKASDSA
jgi:2-methylisocitrate lyase-like PEP mutase family enzyme